MIIKAVKLYKNGFMTQPFAFGGEEGEDKFDEKIKYRSSLQNFLIDTGNEVILIDTGMPKETPDMVADDNTKIYLGQRIEDYVSALKTAGYSPEDVTKIIVTHKHEDHTGELRSFPNATIYIGKDDADSLKLEGKNVVRATFEDGPFYNFPRSQKIAEDVYMIEAIGHTNGNSIIIAKQGDIFFMCHGDVTYTDEALYANKLSIVYENKEKARETLDNIREFIRNHKTVYLSTHTPLGYENLDEMKIVDLNVPIKSKPLDEIVYKTATGKYICSICGYVYDPDLGDDANGIPPGTAFEDLPEDWHCPICKKGKDKFNKA